MAWSSCGSGVNCPQPLVEPVLAEAILCCNSCQKIFLLTNRAVDGSEEPDHPRTSLIYLGLPRQCGSVLCNMEMQWKHAHLKDSFLENHVNNHKSIIKVSWIINHLFESHLFSWEAAPFSPISVKVLEVLRHGPCRQQQHQQLHDLIRPVAQNTCKIKYVESWPEHTDSPANLLFSSTLKVWNSGSFDQSSPSPFVSPGIASHPGANFELSPVQGLSTFLLQNVKDSADGTGYSQLLWGKTAAGYQALHWTIAAGGPSFWIIAPAFLSSIHFFGRRNLPPTITIRKMDHCPANAERNTCYQHLILHLQADKLLRNIWKLLSSLYKFPTTLPRNSGPHSNLGFFEPLTLQAPKLPKIQREVADIYLCRHACHQAFYIILLHVFVF